MPVTATSARSEMVKFLKSRRSDIEDAAISFLGEDGATSHIWSDHIGSTGSQCNPSFNSLCESITKSGMGGHWLCSGLGEAEIHLLGRALGVTVHCVYATKEGRGSYSLRQNIKPSMAYWSGALNATPKGAVVVRFMGRYEGGHYQIVHCGPRSSRSGYAEQLNSSRKGIKRDIEAIRKLHGVQKDTKKRYHKDYRLIDSAMRELKVCGKDPLDLNNFGSDVVAEIMGVLLRRCGPRNAGYEGLSASSTGRVILAAAASWYKDNGISFSDTHTCVVDGKKVSGPPWKAQQLLEFKESLDKVQVKSRSIPVKRAYQLTHDDVAAAMREYVAGQLGNALDPKYPPGTNPNVNWTYLQTALMVTASFGSGCRGGEITSIRLSDLSFLTEDPDTTIRALLHGVKAKKGSKTRRQVIFPVWKETAVICPAMAILTQIAVVHGLQTTGKENSPLFLNVGWDQVRKGVAMSPDFYSTNVGNMFSQLGISNCATEHSPRRGGSGFRYYVLRETIDYIRQWLGHSNIADTLVYIGFYDVNNSYVAQGYGTCGSGVLR